MNNTVYKLKQKYPSLPCDWEVGMEVSIGDYRYNFSPMNAKYTDREISNDEVRNNPEFWEKVEENTYKILSLMYNNNIKILCYLQQNGKYAYSQTPQSTSPLLNCLKSNWQIHSVKRLSDGEVFTIGDKVDESIAINNKYAWNISEFSLKDNRCFTCGVNIDYIKKVKEVLFTTEDGVDIIDPQQMVYLVNPINCATCEIKARIWDKTRLIFSTKKAALNYIKLNKPVLNYNDVLELYNNCSHIHHLQYYKQELTKLVKSKL